MKTRKEYSAFIAAMVVCKQDLGLSLDMDSLRLKLTGHIVFEGRCWRFGVWSGATQYLYKSIYIIHLHVWMWRFQKLIDNRQQYQLTATDTADIAYADNVTKSTEILYLSRRTDTNVKNTPSWSSD